jgi:cell wall-associated NlpC family hydrolase
MWSDDYLGLPWKDLGRDREGVDCYGLACLPLAELWGIALPSYAGAYTSALERAETAALIEGRPLNLVRPVAPGEARAFDFILMRNGQIADHIGLVVRPGLMLHIQVGGESTCDEYDGPLWSRRVVGFFRHPGTDGQALQVMK